MGFLSHSLFAPLITPYFSRLIGFFLAQSCRVRTAHQPLEAPEGIKRADSECDRNPEGV